MSSIPKIVILGAGYGGILTAQRLQKELNYNEADVTLVNRHDYHYITTHLHMPAAGTDSIENTRVSISKLIDEFKIDLVKSSVQEIRLHDKKVILEDGTLSYDYLIIALGGEPETFGIPGLAEHAMSIRSINSVRLIRSHIEHQFALYKNERRPQERINFVVGGAGFSGIEFVAELADRIPKLCKEYDVDPALVNIYNVEAAPSALPGFAPELVDYAMELLTRKGVTFKLGTAIQECTPHGVVLSTGEELRSNTVVWTGGIRGNRLIEAAGLETMRGRVKVDEYLRAPGHDHIYIIGDNSLVLNGERPYPPTAQMAIQQGICCAQNIVATIRGKVLRKFQYQHKGTVASLGKGQGIGVVGSKQYQGWKAAQLKKLVDLRYLFMIGGIPLVLRKGRFL
ncbi:FAD-dependent pyridine nucleotide-disulfide oxidoreductase [Paenibacillus algicola]|uniref:FAD-dependent pyridine nucleotide-disulfide oxidoreductase n=1 Tax=Paenibacillus algicola TaxID=2565926 RepID=A0A4P8XNJ3_9BACL|nr:NAD(P)/FAD-dependent oxidoreductase [Paenibacillus algicola]QCT04158.1 FAD-dependent pyridine nucleotide-disulfide oxidoreductase [Paenibacillus algicola]